MSPRNVKRDSSSKTTPRTPNRRSIEHSSRVLVTIAWVVSMLVYALLWIKGLRNSVLNDISNLSLIIPLLGGSLGIRSFSYVQKPNRLAPRLFCFGLLSWSVGSMIWIYYNLKLHDEVPYPSLADAGYFPCTLLFTVGIIVLYAQLRREHILKDLGGHLMPILAFLWTLAVGIMTLAHGPKLSRYSPATELSKFMLDISYPILDAFNLALLFTVLARVKRKHIKKMQPGLWIIFSGYVLLFLADLMFDSMSSLPENSPIAYFNGGPTDAVFASAFYVISIGLLTMPGLSKPAFYR